jgi:hypothetical protein
MMFAQKDARVIAKKLRAEIKEKRKHDVAIVKIEGKYIGCFGIQRCSKDKSHDYIPQQMFLSPRQCREFKECSLTVDAYADLLRGKGQLE